VNREEEDADLRRGHDERDNKNKNLGERREREGEE